MKNIEIIKSIDIKQIISKETGLQFKKDTLRKCPFYDSGTGTFYGYVPPPGVPNVTLNTPINYANFSSTSALATFLFESTGSINTSGVSKSRKFLSR